jgi:glycosyltransferase involved in cell wall biosynthesis
MAILSSLLALVLDVGPLQDDQWTGIPVFTRRLAKALIESGRVDLRFCVGFTPVPARHVLSAMRYGTGAFLREELVRESAAEGELPDAATPVLFTSVKRIFGVYDREASTVHDMSTLFMPENHKADNVAFHLDHFVSELATNEVTFCVSEATEAALLAAFPSVKGRTQTLYQYVDWPEEFAQLDRNMPRIKLGRYAAVIGTIEPRKNLGLLLRALSSPELQDSELKFVIIGRKGWMVDDFLAQLRPQDRKRLIFSGFVSEFIKYRLLKQAEFLVYPSVYEGFGIPALEAMSLGKPVLASRTSSFPEVIGDAGVYFDPFSTTDFAAGLAELDHKDRQAELGALALEESRAFNPARMSKPVIDWLRQH